MKKYDLYYPILPYSTMHNYEINAVQVIHYLMEPHNRCN